jgi:uncharacterized surface protein with fasciclin (FAS1) repeats
MGTKRPSPPSKHLAPDPNSCSLSKLHSSAVVALLILEDEKEPPMDKRSGLCAALFAAALSTTSICASAFAAGEPMVGGAPMYPNKTVVENASQAKNLTTLVAAVKAGGLVDTLSGAGPFTVFAPTNAAFEKLPSGAVEKLVQPDMKPTLTKILTYHVVAGRMTSTDLAKAIKEGGGTANLKTVEGGALSAQMDGEKIVLVDEKGGRAVVEQADVLQSNGVAHVIDTVLMPK